jgi:hypothetical protein
MNPWLQQLLDLYIAPTPTPAGMTSREIVRRAIKFDSPPRIPYSFLIPLASDFFEVAALPPFLDAADAEGDNPVEILANEKKKKQMARGSRYYDEWGVGQEVTGRTWDHAFDHPLRDLSKLDACKFPDLASPDRFDRLQPYIEKAREAGKYIVAFDPVMMFERMRALLGFEELMVAPYTQPEGLQALLERLSTLIISIIKQWARIGGVDAYMTWEDWGLQTTLQMNPKIFRRFYKPWYARIVQTAHEHGMHYIWHNCGQILDIIPDMIEIGVDVAQLDQPRLMGYRELADRFGGRICFWNTLDIQWSTTANPSDDDIRREVGEMVRTLNQFNGGLMARHYPDPDDINLSPERHMVIYEAFMENGCSL